MHTKIFKTFLDKDGNEVKKLAVSYSQLDTFLTCPRRWMYRYLKGYGKSDDTESTQLGTQIHASIEEYCKRLSEGYEWTVAEAIDLVQNNLNKRTIKFKDVDEEIVEQHKAMMEGLVTGSGELAKLLDKCDVLAQELEFKLPIKLPFKVRDEQMNLYDEVILNGFIDLVLKDRETGGIIVIDHKTGKSLFKPIKLRTNLQLPIYSLVIKSVYGELPKRCSYYFTRFDKLQDVQPLAPDEASAECVYFKTGKKKGQLKSKQRTVDDIVAELLSIFKRMYAQNTYTTSSTPLCSWCPFGAYGDLRCDDAQFYKRSDIDLPVHNKVTI